MTHVLVTGGAGYIGSQCCKLIASKGLIPVTFDSLERGHRDLVQWGPLVQGDLADPKALDRAFQEFKPVAVFHFAAYTSVPESIENPKLYEEKNLTNTQKLLSAMKKNGVSQLVFSSTAAVYGNAEKSPIAETDPPRPINPYGQTKLDAESLIDRAVQNDGLKAISFRYFNAAGADPDGQTGERHHPPTHLIPIIFDVAMGLSPVLKIFGDRYPTRDGTCVRDYIHILDLAEAHWLGFQYLKAQQSPGHLRLNLGTSNGFTVKEVHQMVEKITGKKVPTQIAPARDGDGAASVADSSQARKILGWAPQHSNLADLIRSGWAWHLQWKKKFLSEKK